MDKPHYKTGAILEHLSSRDIVAETIFPTASPTAFPKVYDLTSLMMPVRDQGQQGSCVAMAVSAIKEYQEHINVALMQPLSPQFIYNMRVNRPTEGMQSSDAMDILLEFGICSEYQYPYGTQGEVPTDCVKSAGNFKIKSHGVVTSVDGLKTALMKQGPCYIDFHCWNYSDKFWHKNPGDVSLGGHAVAIVGWNDAGFILRNSWGSGWGNGGYTTYPYGEFGMHSIIRTCLDDDSSKPIPQPPPQGCCSIV